MAILGTRLSTDKPNSSAHESFVQPADSNPLYIDTERRFEPLTDTFAADPLLHALLALLGRIATALDEAEEWSAKVTPFRVLASVQAQGQPTPEGLHRDGVTLVTSLLIWRMQRDRRRIQVVDMNGETLRRTTPRQPARCCSCTMSKDVGMGVTDPASLPHWKPPGATCS